MLTAMLRKAVEAEPGKAAIVQGGRRVRYDELEQLAGRCANGLRRLGVGIGDCVAVVLPNCPEFVVSLFACVRLRAVMLPVNPQYTREEIQRILLDARARVVITESAGAGLSRDASAIVTGFEALLSDDIDPMPRGRFQGPALYLYTSGSTDTRKRLCCTQENLFCEALNFVETVGLTAEDNILCTLPLCHSYGLGNCLLDAVYTGSTLVLLELNGAPFGACCRRVLELIRDEAIRFYPGAPYQFGILATLPDHTVPELASLKLCVSSGDVLPRQTYERFLERFGLPIRSLYGSTEAGSICMNTDPVEKMQFGSLGLPLENVTIEIRDEMGREIAGNESGRIWVKSPVIPPTGYDNRPELTAQVFRGGYYNTGDIGKKDERGHLVMTGRKQTFVDVGGSKVDIAEVEEVLQSHPRVREAAVLGVETPELGTLLKAVLVTDGLREEADILAYCRGRLAVYKIPRLVEFRDELPRSPLGKVLKTELGDVTELLANVCRDDFERRWSAVAGQARAEQIEFLAERIMEQVALTLQRESASVERSASFQSMGFDSLRAAELYARLSKLTGLPLTITMLWNYPTVGELADALWSQLNPHPVDGLDTDGERVLKWRSPKSVSELLHKLEGLSDADVEAALRGE